MQNQIVSEKWLEVLCPQTIENIESYGLLDFTAYQENDRNTSLKLSFALDGEFEGKKSLVCGTILNELFKWVEFQKSINAKALKLNSPILLKFSVGGVTFDTGLCHKETKQTLLLQNTDKGRKRYAVKFWNTFKYSTQTVTTLDISELISGLEAAILKAA